MVTLKASLVFSSTSLSKIPPSPNTWSGATSFPLGARTLAYLRLNSVGGYLEASDWADPVLGGDISPLVKVERERQEIFLIFQIFFHLDVTRVAAYNCGSREERWESRLRNREEEEERPGGSSSCVQLGGSARPASSSQSRIYLFGLLRLYRRHTTALHHVSLTHLDGILDTDMWYPHLNLDR